MVDGTRVCKFPTVLCEFSQATLRGELFFSSEVSVRWTWWTVKEV